MGNTKNQIQRQVEIQDGQTIEVLYQKMGNRWFAFSVVDDEVFVGSLTQEEILQGSGSKSSGPKVHRITGNS